jgi:hypothetical protein
MGNGIQVLGQTCGCETVLPQHRQLKAQLQFIDRLLSKLAVKEWPRELFRLFDTTQLRQADRRHQHHHRVPLGVARVRRIVSHQFEHAFGFTQVKHWQEQSLPSNESCEIRTSNLFRTRNQRFSGFHRCLQVPIQQVHQCRDPDWLQHVGASRVTLPLDSRRVLQCL